MLVIGNDEYENLKQKAEEINAEVSSEIAKEIKIYAAISFSVGAFIKDLQNMLLKKYSEMKEKEFKYLLEQMNKFDKTKVGEKFPATHKEVSESIKFKTEVKGDVGEIVNIDIVDTGGGNFNV